MKKRIVKIAFVIFLIVLVVWAADYIVGYKQDKLLQERAAHKKKLELLAWQVLRSQIEDVTYKGNKYKIAITYENPFPDEEIYVMVPTIRALVQVGTYWKEVPIHDLPGRSTEPEVVRLTDKMTVEKLVEVPFRNFEQVLPGYIHMRVNAVSYVLADSISKEDVVEKNEDFYIYLKPYYADDKKMAKNYSFTNNVVPVWIPMPPH